MFTNIECNECGGHLYPALNVVTGEPIYAMCSDCGHEVTEYDLLPNMEEGEVLAFDEQDRLSYIAA